MLNPVSPFIVTTGPFIPYITLFSDKPFTSDR